uniref:Alternative protein OR12D3 n=1 Tax=Homo sapiens TaxID=9606 RepID=L8ECK8_HUMAN|nr:alternative protein OR12D3 [Homo sapiens]
MSSNIKFNVMEAPNNQTRKYICQDNSVARRTKEVGSMGRVRVGICCVKKNVAFLLGQKPLEFSK